MSKYLDTRLKVEESYILYMLEMTHEISIRTYTWTENVVNQNRTCAKFTLNNIGKICPRIIVQYNIQ